VSPPFGENTEYQLVKKRREMQTIKQKEQLQGTVRDDVGGKTVKET